MNQPILQFSHEENGKPVFRLVQEYIYEWDHDFRRFRLIIPAGYLTDKASVPQFAWSLIRPDGAHEAAALCHDFLYQHQGKPPSGSFQVLYPEGWIDKADAWSRKDCDRLFARLMREADCPKWRRRLMYWSVRICGKPFWDRTKKP